MQILLLAVIAGVIAAMVALVGRLERKPPEPLPEMPESADRLLPDAETVERLTKTLNCLRIVMEHPQLGGPGFMTVQFSPFGSGQMEASAQYPNIQETLYRRIVCGELEQKELIAAGIPADLFEWGVEFAAESGGMVLICVEAGSLTKEQMMERRDREAVLRHLAETLRMQYPEMAVRVIGGDLLLTPQPQ